MNLTRVGIDVGGVVVNWLPNADMDTVFHSDNSMNTMAIPGVFEAIDHLTGELGPENVYIISKCGPRTAEKTIKWLYGRDFYLRTGFNPANALFCRERHEKAPIAARLGLTHFIDDHLEVLEYMRDSVPHRLLFGPQRDHSAVDETVNGVHCVPTWTDALRVVDQTSVHRV